jgi:hypothetical protein
MAEDDDWTGSAKKPWVNPPMKYKLGAGRGSWRWAMLIILAAVIAVIVVLILVDTDHLDRGWAYAVLPIAIVAAAASRVLTIFKASAEDRTTTD